jgi:hypothetical protein
MISRILFDSSPPLPSLPYSITILRV